MGGGKVWKQEMVTFAPASLNCEPWGDSLQKVWNVHATSRWPWHLTKSVHLQDYIFSTSYRNCKQGERHTWGDYITNAINYDYLPHARLRLWI